MKYYIKSVDTILVINVKLIYVGDIGLDLMRGSEMYKKVINVRHKQFVIDVMEGLTSTQLECLRELVEQFQVRSSQELYPEHRELMARLGIVREVDLGNGLRTYQTIVTFPGLRDVLGLSVNDMEARRQIENIFKKWSALRTDSYPMRAAMTINRAKEGVITNLDLYQQIALMLEILESKGIKGITIDRAGKIRIPAQYAEEPLVVRFGLNSLQTSAIVSNTYKSEDLQKKYEVLSFFTGEAIGTTNNAGLIPAPELPGLSGTSFYYRRLGNERGDDSIASDYSPYSGVVFGMRIN